MLIECSFSTSTTNSQSGRCLPMIHRRCVLHTALLFSFLFSGNAAAAEVTPSYTPELNQLRQAFLHQVGNAVSDESYLRQVQHDMLQMIQKITCLEPEYFLYVDRNPERQLAFVALYDPDAKRVELIGNDKVSTGNPKRKGHFLTPIGRYENTTTNVGYRAEGTKNKKGWRGLGAKGSRVWDLGWQWTYIPGGKTCIRLLIHASDPVGGEKRLGKVDSKGCVRISAKLNRFLDHYGILDRNFEAKKNVRSLSWLLKSDRQPVMFAGRYLFVSDSQMFIGPLTP